MTVEQATKHKEIIKWWLDNPEKGVWFQNYKSDKWHLSYKPAFIELDTYVQNDKHAKARKWKADGKQLQRRTLWNDNCNFNKSWNDYDKSNTISTNHNGTEVEYRIKPNEPKLKAGDWVIDNGNTNTEICQIRQIMLDCSVDDFDTRFKLWKPTKDEWCVFWNDNTSYIIDEFKDMTADNINYVRKGNPIAYTNIAPLEFALTLKDK